MFTAIMELLGLKITMSEICQQGMLYSHDIFMDCLTDFIVKKQGWFLHDWGYLCNFYIEATSIGKSLPVVQVTN